ncbi:Uncharacterised protein [Vibrio cholerae]|nr:Uncharacterised protein [Vibrio cholerae]CSI73259.1 Uncharacterised protein [Vibrio cholerae]
MINALRKTTVASRTKRFDLFGCIPVGENHD